MPFECPQDVTNDLEKLLENDEEYDVIIYAGENENIKEIHAHSIILRTRSQYFRSAFSNEWSEKKNGKFIFKKPNISPQFFKIILRFIYCGKIDLEKLQGPDILKLLIAVDEIDIQTLTDHLEEYLIKHQDAFIQENPIKILEAIYENKAFTNLWDLYSEKICGEPEILFNSDKFTSLKAPLLELLLKRDDLSLDEIVIWESLIKWCLAQHRNVPRNPTRWNKEETTIMAKTIHRFIPLIRFNYIYSEDFIFKVYPFKEIIPKVLVNNILIFHMAPNKQLYVDIQPPRQPKCVRDIYDSIIIESHHFAIFSSWIEKEDQFYFNVKSIPYNFNLLYRASRDGDTPAAFHAKCDYKGATISVAKITNSDQIVGGYNPLYWYSGITYMSANDSFIFSFKNKNNFQSAKIGYSNGLNSIGGFTSNGPVFGGNYGCHLAAGPSSGTWFSNPTACNKTYPKIGIPENDFNVDDYEVFQVVKR
ncbi:hypothetical protein C1646_815568 [Rhizophagus diaphanus]|nr:hypothetical protein C1646_815568 [Rhizophagus diaphanus] [Rhizophagus sp. MUCL 43196]